MNLGRLAEAKSHYHNALSIWENLGNDSQQAVLLNNLGVITQISGDYIAAKKWFSSAQKKAKTTSNLRMEAFTYASLGDLAFDLNLFEIGGDFYQKALSVVQITHEGYLQSYLEICLAKYFRKIANYQIASKHMRTALDQISRNASEGDMGLWYLERGQLDRSIGNITTAE